MSEEIMEKMKIANKERLEKGIALEMIEKIQAHLIYFISKTYGAYISEYFNGFTAVGILNTPTDHIIKGVNTIWFYLVGFNKDGTDIEVKHNNAMRLDEAEVIYKAFGNCIKKYKKLKRKKRLKK